MIQKVIVAQLQVHRVVDPLISVWTRALAFFMYYKSKIDIAFVLYFCYKILKKDI
jgi:hypothetical protein